MTTIFIAGDSTAAEKLAEKRPETGWGEKIPLFFNKKIKFSNHAKNGRSTKSFIAEGRLDEIQEKITKNDYLFIQFGHNDQKVDNPERGTKPYDDYLDNLAKFIEVANNHMAHPVLLTPVTRRDYLADGRLNPQTLGEYPQAMIEFAEKQKVPVLDTFTRSQNWLAQFNKDETCKFYLHGKPNQWRNYPEGVVDNTHFSEQGAIEIARIIAEAIRESSLPLRKDLL